MMLLVPRATPRDELDRLLAGGERLLQVAEFAEGGKIAITVRLLAADEAALIRAADDLQLPETCRQIHEHDGDHAHLFIEGPAAARLQSIARRYEPIARRSAL